MDTVVGRFLSLFEIGFLEFRLPAVIATEVSNAFYQQRLCFKDRGLVVRCFQICLPQSAGRMWFPPSAFFPLCAFLFARNSNFSAVQRSGRREYKTERLVFKLLLQVLKELLPLQADYWSPGWTKDTYAGFNLIHKPKSRLEDMLSSLDYSCHSPRLNLGTRWETPEANPKPSQSFRNWSHPVQLAFPRSWIIRSRD